MDYFANLYFLIYFAVFAAIAIILVVSFKREKQTPTRISTSRHIQIRPDEALDNNSDSYDLDWKPNRDKPIEIPADVLKLLDSIQEISSMVIDLSGRIGDPDINPQEISHLISSDQGLTSHVLRRVNSPFYGLVQKINNIFNAIVILGYNEIHRIVMEEHVAKAGIQPSKEDWVHANLTSNIAAHITSASRSGIPGGTMVTLGMLHDIGKTILDQIKPSSEIEFSDDPREHLRQEIEIYGIDHATLGAELARRWRIPESLCSCIEKHHWPMFWPLRDVGQDNAKILKELALLSISDIAAQNFTGTINGSYIGNDYYNYLKLSPDMNKLIDSKLKNDLYRIKSVLDDE